MGALQEKEEWVDSVENGELSCEHCTYRTNSEEHLQTHKQKYHGDGRNFIYYMGCSGSLDGRNTLAEYADVQWIDMTGGQAAFEDGGEDYPLSEFGEDLVRGARETGYKLYHVFKMYDPGLGLDFPMWWVEAGIEAGTFERFDIPDDVNACLHSSSEEEQDEGSDESE